MEQSQANPQPPGPLDGIRVVELQGLGPAPFAAMLLADLGADVVRVDRVARDTANAELDGLARAFLARGRRSIAVDLTSSRGVEVLLTLVDTADVLVEGFRPGVAERLGLGPATCLERNPRLVYGRATGWGREGPYADAAGHDITYIALSGALWPIGRQGGPPVPPLAYLGDFGGGGMLLALGICAALTERAASGHGQVVDAAMVDGSALISGFLHAVHAAGQWRQERGANLIDSGAPFYDTYETADGKWVAVGAIEPQFYRELLAALGIDEPWEAQMDRARWPRLRERLAATFRTRTRDEWEELLAGTQACVAPVLSPWEAPSHPHHVARGTFTSVAGMPQPAPAPRFDRTPGRVARPAPEPGRHTTEVLTELGLGAEEIAALRADGHVG